MPLQRNLKLQNDGDSKEVDATLYIWLVGSLIYLATAKSDLTFSVSVLSQFISKPLENHWVVAKCAFRYLQGTIDVGIKYTNYFDVNLTGFSDSNWVGNLDDRISVTGYSFNVRYGVIDWSSKKQSTISLSSAKV